MKFYWVSWQKFEDADEGVSELEDWSIDIIWFQKKVYLSLELGVMGTESDQATWWNILQLLKVSVV